MITKFNCRRMLKTQNEFWQLSAQAQGRGPLLSCLAKKGTGRSVGGRVKARTYKSLADALLTLLLFIFLRGILLMTNVWPDLLGKLFIVYLRCGRLTTRVATNFNDFRNIEDKYPMCFTHYSWQDRAARG